MQALWGNRWIQHELMHNARVQCVCLHLCAMTFGLPASPHSPLAWSGGISLSCLTQAQQRKVAQEDIRNKLCGCMPPCSEWFLPKSEYKSVRERLILCGNLVIPAQAEVALQLF